MSSFCPYFILIIWVWERYVYVNCLLPWSKCAVLAMGVICYGWVQVSQVLLWVICHTIYIRNAWSSFLCLERGCWSPQLTVFAKITVFPLRQSRRKLKIFEKKNFFTHLKKSKTRGEHCKTAVTYVLLS